jgi:hypothetical protein
MAAVGLKRPAVPVSAVFRASNARGNAPIAAIHHIRRLPGATQPHLMLAGDGRRYVVKFRNNPVHPRILANELLATRIALRLGLPMPDVAVIEVSDWLISHTPKLRLHVGERIVPCIGGLHLASCYVADPEQGETILQILPRRMRPRLADRDAFARILPFDKWAGNCDNRQALFVKRRPKPVRYEVVFLDQGDCFGAAQWAFPDLSLMGAYDQNWVYGSVTGWESFEPTLSRIESVDATGLWNIAVEVPQHWYQHDGPALAKLIETLSKRRSLVRDLIARFRRSQRNPFPNWRR